MSEGLSMRWLGAAGIELTAAGQVLAIDPFFTRPPLRNLWFGRPVSNMDLVARHLPRCAFILVTHPHWDHLMDVPAAARHTGARVYGSANTCHLAMVLGLPAGQLETVAAGDRLDCGPFEVWVEPATHVHTPLARCFAGPLPAAPDLLPPLALRAYRMDRCFSFVIEVSGQRILHGDAPLPADVWLTAPSRPAAYYRNLLAAIQPRLVLPIHWDDFFRPLALPMRPMLAPPARALPPLRFQDPARFARQLAAMAPGIRVLLPQALASYRIA